MKLNAFWKGLIMALVGFISTTVSDLETFNFAYVAISTLGFTVIYIGKNYAFPSVSVLGLDLRDILSGLIVAGGMAISSYVAQILTVGFDLKTLLVAVGSALAGYLLKTVSSNAEKSE